MFNLFTAAYSLQTYTTNSEYLYATDLWRDSSRFQIGYGGVVTKYYSPRLQHYSAFVSVLSQM